MGNQGPVNHGLALTVRGRGTNFMSFRGHLSRPACSHVKKLAKQAGDRMIPAELPFRPDFLWPDFRGGLGKNRAPRDRDLKMVKVQSVPSPAVASEERSHEADHPS